MTDNDTTSYGTTDRGGSSNSSDRSSSERLGNSSTNTSTTSASTMGTADRTPEPLRPRATTIVWGIILLIVAALAFTVSTIDPEFITAEVTVWAVVGFGALLVVAGAIGAVVRAARRRESDY
ncbi:BCD family MFS transporter [Marisediminicola senii]|uniref:BCD family MFS transporter n=1 Tax=Marisediminicola senii TaxID=2711233 RepID=UPI0013EB3855|nr:BCD family MFS transporter [Marisediminicola senii]